MMTSCSDSICCCCAFEQVRSIVHPQLVLGAHGYIGGLPCCLLRCR